MTYGIDAAATHLSNAYWFLDTGDTQPNDPLAENLTATTNRRFITRWQRISASKEVQIFGRLQSDISNVLLNLLPGVRLHIRLTNARPNFQVMNKSVEPKTLQIFVRPITDQMRQAEPRHVAGSNFDTEQGESRAL